MLKRIFGLAAFLLLVLPAVGVTSSEAVAQSLKVGYTDHEVIIANMPKYRQIQEQLQKEYQGGQDELQALMKDYQDKLEKYQKQQALLSPERRQEREQELMQLQGQLQQSAQKKEQDLAQREMELMSPLFQAVDQAINEVAKQKSLDLVLRSQVGVQPVILYVNERTVVDITPDVARKLGLEVENEAPPTSSN